VGTNKPAGELSGKVSKNFATRSSRFGVVSKKPDKKKDCIWPKEFRESPEDEKALILKNPDAKGRGKQKNRGRSVLGKVKR